jgi:DNA-binding NarL/FixJ family response regulator
MARGYTNSGIAKQLFVSTKTVEAHIGRIFEKLGVYDQWGTNRRVLAIIRWLNQDGAVRGSGLLVRRTLPTEPT